MYYKLADAHQSVQNSMPLGVGQVPLTDRVERRPDGTLDPPVLMLNAATVQRLIFFIVGLKMKH